jgi:transcriptional regulator with XRE-family HTH domain
MPPRSKPRPDGRLSQQLREAIEASGRSLAEIGRLANVSHTVLSRFLNGKRTIRLDTAAAVADVLRYQLTPKAKPAPRRSQYATSELSADASPVNSSSDSPS